MTSQPEAPWYSQLREQWRPKNVRLLLIGESVPDDGGDPANRRFFYSSVLTGRDTLFRGVVHALYGVRHLDSRVDTKQPWLERLRADGVFLIDLIPYPVNGPDKKRLRAQARRENAVGCADRVGALRPEGIIVCHGPSFKVLRAPLHNVKAPLLHEAPIPFPLGNWREAFVEGFHAALERMPPKK